MSVYVDPEGNASVFLQGSHRGLAGVDVAGLAEAMAARGLRLRGVSSSVSGAPAIRPAGLCTTFVGDESLVDAVLSLIDLRDEVRA
jgi:hypothetical protein